MATITVCTHTVPEISARSMEEADRLLDQLAESHRGAPIVVELVAESGRSATIGVGAACTAVYLESSGDRPSRYSACGDGSSRGAVVFHYGGHWTEIGPGYLVPMDVGREAVRQWLANETLTPLVRWQADG